jgi:hypothetical protein
LKGVSVARRKRVNPPAVTTSRRRLSPACAPRQQAPSCERLVEPELLADHHHAGMASGAETGDELAEERVQPVAIDCHDALLMLAMQDAQGYAWPWHGAIRETA